MVNRTIDATSAHKVRVGRIHNGFCSLSSDIGWTDEFYGAMIRSDDSKLGLPQSPALAN